MKWFKKHLNWTLGFATVLSLLLAIPYVVQDIEGKNTTLALIILFLGFVIFFITGYFTLKQKGRSLWYLALTFIPYAGGIIAPVTWLVLSNVSRQKASINKKPESDSDTM